MKPPLSKNELIERFSVEQFKFLFFWGHTEPNENSLTKACFSQWYPSSFEIEGITYLTAEHYMMAEKARIFGADEIRKKVIACSDPAYAKKLGRSVPDFDPNVWNKRSFEIVTQGSFAKFSQNPPLLQFLQNTGNQILVEASPPDTIWGIGLGQDNPKSQDPNLWRGLNLLGFALMVAREQLQPQQ